MYQTPRAGVTCGQDGPGPPYLQSLRAQNINKMKNIKCNVISDHMQSQNNNNNNYKTMQSFRALIKATFFLQTCQYLYDFRPVYFRIGLNYNY